MKENLKEEVKNLIKMELAPLKGDLNQRISTFNNSLKECEICGCLLLKATAIRGESVIEREGGFYSAPTEKIREVYYCKAHAPKINKK